jgi:hypothetical protein
MPVLPVPGRALRANAILPALLYIAKDKGLPEKKEAFEDE